MKSTVKDNVFSWSILAVAVLLRFMELSLKPPHSDEGVNGFFVNQLWENGFLVYDPQNYHGPLLFYLFQLSEKIFGFGVYSFRIVTALFSVLTVWIVLRSRILGRHASFFAAGALALSPGMIFFGRSAIHESVFVFFQILWMTGFVKFREQPERRGLLWFFAGLLGCALLKETFVVLAFSFLAAWVWVEFSPRILRPIDGQVGPPPRFQAGDIDRSFILKMVFAGGLVWLSFYTGFFHHRRGAADFFVALMPWLKTGVGGSGHDKPFLYWLLLLKRYEWVALAGAIGALAGAFSRSWKMRFFSALGLVSGLVYSLIPYKTPWCVMDILWPFVIVAGFWFESFSARFREGNIAVVLLSLVTLAVVLTQSAIASYEINFVNYANPSEPYVYVQTKNDLKVIGDIIRKKIESSPELHTMNIQVNLRDSWPLPWLFSRLPHAEFIENGAPPLAGADIIFTELAVSADNLAGSYWRRKMELRDAREPVYVYLKKSAFEGLNLPGFSSVQTPEGKGL